MSRLGLFITLKKDLQSEFVVFSSCVGEVGGTVFLENTGKRLPDSTVPQSRRQQYQNKTYEIKTPIFTIKLSTNEGNLILLKTEVHLSNTRWFKYDRDKL